MNFTGRRARDDEPEINLIPLIDVLLVILIFLAATTTFLRQTALQVALPEAGAQPAPPATLELAISRDGRYALDGALVEAASSAALAERLRAAVSASPDTVLVIQADAQTAHQNVVDAMEAARQAGIARVNFAARTAP